MSACYITNLCIVVSVGTENLFDSFSLLEKLGHGPWRLVHTALGRLLILHGNLDTFVYAIINIILCNSQANR